METCVKQIDSLREPRHLENWTVYANIVRFAYWTDEIKITAISRYFRLLFCTMVEIKWDEADNNAIEINIASRTPYSHQQQQQQQHWPLGEMRWKRHDEQLFGIETKLTCNNIFKLAWE